MKYIKSTILFLIILFSLSTIVLAEDSQEIASNLINEYLKSYQTEDIPKDLKLRSYTITNIDILSENDNQIICNFSARIKPKSLHHGWSTTQLEYYVRIEKNNNEWKITEKTTSPLGIGSSTNEQITSENKKIETNTSNNVSIVKKFIITIIFLVLILIIVVKKTS